MPLIITAISATVSAALIQKRPGRRIRSCSSVNRGTAAEGPSPAVMPSRRSSRVPSMKATPNTNTRPTICTGTSGRNRSATGMWSAAEARSMGPVHGRKLTPAAMEVTHARMRLSIWRRSKSGSIAGMVTRNVTAPEPSRWTSKARSAAPMTTRGGRVPTTRRMRSTMGSSRPASVITPK